MPFFLYLVAIYFYIDSPRYIYIYLYICICFVLHMHFVVFFFVVRGFPFKELSHVMS